MQLKNAKSNRIGKPFFKDKKISIETLADSKMKIIGFSVTYKDKRTEFPVKNLDILKAWQALEKHVADIE